MKHELKGILEDAEPFIDGNVTIPLSDYLHLTKFREEILKGRGHLTITYPFSGKHVYMLTNEEAYKKIKQLIEANKPPENICFFERVHNFIKSIL